MWSLIYSDHVILHCRVRILYFLCTYNIAVSHREILSIKLALYSTVILGITLAYIESIFNILPPLDSTATCNNDP